MMYKDETGKREYRTRSDDYIAVDEGLSSGRQQRQKELEYELEKIKEKNVIVRQAMPRSDEERIEKIRLNGSNVIGSIFDRVQFLQKRIEEIEDSINVRKTLHESILREIEKDIEDREHMASVISDSNERRNLKLDVSVLRKEKRHEHVQFWKDITELTMELRELMEQHETEKKIASLFSDSNVADRSE